MRFIHSQEIKNVRFLEKVWTLLVLWSCYLRRCLASGEGIVTLGATLSHCVCVCPPHLFVSAAKVMRCIQWSLVVIIVVVNDSQYRANGKLFPRPFFLIMQLGLPFFERKRVSGTRKLFSVAFCYASNRFYLVDVFACHARPHFPLHILYGSMHASTPLLFFILHGRPQAWARKSTCSPWKRQKMDQYAVLNKLPRVVVTHKTRIDF